MDARSGRGSVLGGDIGEGESLDLLADLVAKSLVAVEAEGRRYRFLETVRQYAQERLTDSGGEALARTRHLVFYLALAEKARPELVGPAQETWLARLDVERENLLSAHEWCDHAGEGAELGLKLASSLRRYWMIRGLLGLGHHVTVEALGRPGAEQSSLSRSEALFDAGQLGSWMGRYPEAQGYLEESWRSPARIGDKQRVARVLQPLGLAFLGQGNLAAARRHFEEALVLARELGNKREYAAALNALAQLHRAEGELDTAEPLYRNVLALARELADRESIAIALLNLAMVSIARGFGERARAMLLEVSTIADEIGSAPLGQSAMDVVRRSRLAQSGVGACGAVLWCCGGANEADRASPRSRRRGVLDAADCERAQGSGRSRILRRRGVRSRTPLRGRDGGGTRLAGERFVIAARRPQRGRCGLGNRTTASI
jgi:tetratricopeptide (TPR) repeat protein